MGRNNLFAYLMQKQVLRFNNEPFQEFMSRGYFKVIEQSYRVNGIEKINNKTLVTQKGIDYIAKLLTGDGYVTN